MIGIFLSVEKDKFISHNIIARYEYNLRSLRFCNHISHRKEEYIIVSFGRAPKHNYLYSNDCKRDQKEEWDRKNIRTELESDEMFNEVGKSIKEILLKQIEKEE